MLALLLLASWWCLIWCCDDFGQVEQQCCSSCSCVLGLLVTYPVQPVDGFGLGFTVEAYIPPFPCSPGRQLGLALLMTHWLVCVCCAACTLGVLLLGMHTSCVSS
jgi:hypothetical protein